MRTWALAAALASALFYAVAAALQQHEASEDPTGDGLVWHLCRRPRWVAGIAAMAAGAGLHTLALSVGPLALVQPIGSASLLFALPLGARLHQRPMRRRDWWAAVAVAIGLTLFLHVARIRGHHPHLSNSATMVLVTATAVSIAICTTWARHRTGPRRAVALAAAAGIAFGASSALVRAIGAHVVAAGAPALICWPTLALAAVAPAGFVLCQHAYRDGSLGAALSTMTVIDPISAIAFAAGLLGETIHTGILGAVAATVAAALVVTGIVVLSGDQTPQHAAIDDATQQRLRTADRPGLSVIDRALTRTG